MNPPSLTGLILFKTFLWNQITIIIGIPSHAINFRAHALNPYQKSL